MRNESGRALRQPAGGGVSIVAFRDVSATDVGGGRDDEDDGLIEGTLFLLLLLTLLLLMDLLREIDELAAATCAATCAWSASNFNISSIVGSIAPSDEG